MCRQEERLPQGKVGARQRSMERIRPVWRITSMKTLVVGLILLALVGCDEQQSIDVGGSRAAVADPKNPCELLSPQQVEDAIGTEVTGEQEVGSHDPATRICSYETDKPWASVSLSLRTDVSTDAFEKKMRRDRINTQPVEGIGEGAFIHACASISVLVSNVSVDTSIQHLTTCDETGAVLRKLGTTVVSALQPTSAP